MLTAVVSDLHLAAANDADLARRDDARALLLEGIGEADRLVLLGDVIELRDRPVATALELAAPVLRELADAVGGKVVLVPGNHDHRLVSGWLEQRPQASLGLAEDADLGPWPGSALAEALDGVPLRVAYPGVWLRDDVYATHGHYLDRHLTIPTFERVGIALIERTLGLTPADADPLDPPDQDPEPDSPDDYERIAAPIYAFLFALAQAGKAGPHPGGSPSMRIWEALAGGGSSPAGRLRGWLLGSVALPGAVGVANRLGLGPVRADLSPGAITRAGITAMGEVVDRLGIEAAHLIFGHTHRRGPLPGEEPWGRDSEPWLWNTGSWVHSPSLLRETAAESPFWPGTIVLVDEEGPPRHRHLLDEWTRADLART